MVVTLFTVRILPFHEVSRGRLSYLPSKLLSAHVIVHLSCQGLMQSCATSTVIVLSCLCECKAREIQLVAVISNGVPVGAKMQREQHVVPSHKKSARITDVETVQHPVHGIKCYL